MQTTESQLADTPWFSFQEVAGKLLDSLPIVRISQDSSKLGYWHIEHLAGLSYRDLKSYFASLALRSYARNAFIRVSEEIHQDIILDTNTCEREPRVFATVEALEKTADKYLATPNVYIVHYELGKLKSLMGGDELYDRYRMAVNSKPGEYKPPKPSSEPDRRVFTAHAGLNKDIVSVLKTVDSDRVFLGYTCESLKGVEDVARGIINKLRENIINF